MGLVGKRVPGLLIGKQKTRRCPRAHLLHFSNRKCKHEAFNFYTCPCNIAQATCMKNLRSERGPDFPSEAHLRLFFSNLKPDFSLYLFVRYIQSFSR